MRNCKDSNCCKWFINKQGRVELCGNIMKAGTSLCTECVAAMAADVAKPVKKQEKPKAQSKKV